jgi:hypothetical protein
MEGKASRKAKIHSGQLLGNSSIVFEKAEGATINLTGASKG